MPRLPTSSTSNAAESHSQSSTKTRPRPMRGCVVVVGIASIIAIYIVLVNQPELHIERIMEMRKGYPSFLSLRRREVPMEIESPVSNEKRPGKIAILANFISKDPTNIFDPRFGAHLMNKACYADLWGYDFIYNVSWGFPDQIRGRNANSNDNRLCFLEWGQWHRVPHLITLMEDRDYGWILWTDNEYVFWDLTQPLESLFQEMKVNNLHNVHVVVPDDGPVQWQGARGRFLFSSFAVLIRNSHFGRTLLQNWLAFAKGLCPNGNYEDINGCKTYQWKFSDQPGLWYALGKTYSDLVEGSGEFAVSCNNHTGFLDFHGLTTGMQLGFNVSEYFTKEGLIKSSDYSQIPHDQPILWSSYEKDTLSGIGVNNQFIKGLDEDFNGLFAMHTKKQLKRKLQHSQIEYCGRPVAEGGRGCHVGTNEQGVFDLSCGNTSYIAWESNRF